MDSATVLFWLLIVTLVSSVLLLLAASLAMGRKLAELEYQYEAGINGIKRIQSWINVRTHFNRVFLALAFLIAVILALVDATTPWALWVSRLLLIAVLLNYTLSSVLDWVDERKQTRLYLREQEEERRRRQGERVVPVASVVPSPETVEEVS